MTDNNFTINGIPVCGTTFNFYAADGNRTYSNYMLSHGSTLGNFMDSMARWIRLPFPIKVYALSFTTDTDPDQSPFNIAFTVRKDTGDTYDGSNGTGVVTGSTETISNADTAHHQYCIFSSEPTFVKGDSIGLMVSSNIGIGCEFTVKLWCYQI